MAFGDFFGVTRKLNFIDEAERLSRRAPKLLERTGRSVINDGANLLSYSMSGEKLLNDPLKIFSVLDPIRATDPLNLRGRALEYGARKLGAPKGVQRTLGAGSISELIRRQPA